MYQIIVIIVDCFNRYGFTCVSEGKTLKECEDNLNGKFGDEFQECAKTSEWDVSHLEDFSFRSVNDHYGSHVVKLQDGNIIESPWCFIKESK
tara:strand:+ start:68 stop:343 length:276 start_codon:yes stop_codon:yes gene_type:complete